MRVLSTTQIQRRMEEVPEMAKYALLGGYTAEAWRGMIDDPASRRSAVQKAAEAVGGSIEAFYWSFGEDDFLVFAEIPDDIAAAAISVGFGSSGRLRNLRTIKLITTDDAANLLGKAQTVVREYMPPGARQAAGISR
jgi:uncharacterized protein with GYD domain